MIARLLLSILGAILCAYLLCLLPGCKKDPIDGKTTITGRLTEYGIAAPVKEAKIYLSCDESQFGGPPVTKLFDSLSTDADGRFYKEYPAGEFCANVVIQPYKKGYFVPTPLDYVTVPKSYDFVMDPEAWFRLVTIPDLGMWEELGFGGSLRPHSVSSNKGVEQQRFIYPGGRSIVLHWGPFSNPSINYTDSIYLVPHDTTTYTIHY